MAQDADEGLRKKKQYSWLAISRGTQKMQRFSKSLGLIFIAVWISCASAQKSPLPPVRLGLVESLSGPFANTGESVFRNLIWAAERVNARGGIHLPGGARNLVIQRYDNRGESEQSIVALKSAVDDGITIVAQGNSSAVAAVLIDTINKHNEREPNKRVLFLNYSAVDPLLTNEKCSYWHFRFDAHADMRMAALMDVVNEEKALKKIYLIGQDYSFGHSVLREARKQLTARRPDVQIVGEDLHPLGRVKDFIPYAIKIKSSGAQAVLTGNWGNDLTLLIRATKDVGYTGKFYTFYGNALGAPGAIADAGIDKVVAVADWFPNAPGAMSESLYKSFRTRFPNPQDDYVHMRMQLMIEALVQAIESAGSTDANAIAQKLESITVSFAGRQGYMRKSDHQFQQPLLVALMGKQGAQGIPFDVEGSGYGFRVIRTIDAERASLPTTCKMVRP